MNKSIGVRIAIRSDGETIRAFLCSVSENPESGKLLSTLSLDVAMADGGRQGRVFNDWMETLNKWLERTLETLNITGTKLMTIEPGLELGDHNNEH